MGITFVGLRNYTLWLLSKIYGKGENYEEKITIQGDTDVNLFNVGYGIRRN